MSLTDYTPSQIRRAIYEVDLPLLIDREVYPNMPKAVKGNWRTGALHQEWNELFNNYTGILIKAPRNHLKTFFFFEVNALRLCADNPDIEVLYLTGTDPLAIKKLDNIKKIAKRCPWFQHLLDGADTNNKHELVFANGSRISVGGFFSGGRGGHPDVIILDDIIDVSVMYSNEQNEKAKERFAMEILPMLNPDGRCIIAGTVQREDDIYSIDFAELANESGVSLNWVTRTYDAIVDEERHITLYPEKWSWEALMAKKAEIVQFKGERFFNKEYRNMPIKATGTIIKPEWLRTYSREMLPAGLSKFTGWDLSVGKKVDTGDFTSKVSIAVDTTQELPNMYITSVFNERLDFPNRVRAMITQGEVEQPVAIGAEDNAFQSDTVQTAKKNSNLNIVGITTTQNKTEKFIMRLSPLFENGRVFLDMSDPAQVKFWEQLLSLPNGANDDMADALCNAVEVIPSGLYGRAKDFILTL